MSDDLCKLWMQVVAASRRELDRLRQEDPKLALDQDLEELFVEHWPQARQAAIEDLARQEAGSDERRFRDAFRRLDEGIPREYPFKHDDDDLNG